MGTGYFFESDYYPAGAYSDPNAPYNELPEPEWITFDTTIRVYDEQGDSHDVKQEVTAECYLNGYETDADYIDIILDAIDREALGPHDDFEIIDYKEL